MPEFLPDPEVQKQNKINRRRFIKAATAVVIYDLLQSEYQEPVPMPRITLPEFKEIVRYELPGVNVTEEVAPPNVTGDGIGEWSIPETTLSVIRRLFQEKPQDVVADSTEWVSGFQEPLQQEDVKPAYEPVYEPAYESAYEPAEPSQKYTCSKKTRNSCDGLNPKGYPMYVLNTLPEDASMRGFIDWHQRAALKLDDQLYFVVDGSQGTIWNGTLGSYVLTKNEGRMRRTPFASIARFKQAKWDIGPSRIAQVLMNAVSEEEMQSMDVRQNEIGYHNYA
ncbi:MAG: hypothetical protein QF755_03305 [Candidatus Peribacteraceae bacterium]|nr:hypothetical protein [Candidatus Peribacteraceae bacterium]